MPVEERDGYGIAPRAELPRRLTCADFAMDGAPLQEALESLRENIARMGVAAERVAEGMYEMRVAVQTHEEFLRDETRLQVVFRPVAGLPTEEEDDDSWAAFSRCDGMRWRPPAEGEEVPRWLA